MVESFLTPEGLHVGCQLENSTLLVRQKKNWASWLHLLHAARIHQLLLLASLKSLETLTPGMAVPTILLADFKAGRHSNTIRVRMFRFWEVRMLKKGGELMT
ncbi:hypothetical protein HID58_079428 [Brassica napus]|uniref:Uncharacterized protein n=1 Tax=Brassica napus TaxID=3708 RepID=A0ABQ7Y203_BRANA|nr:hypothetical protein HID58_079428 [Brassica napus]